MQLCKSLARGLLTIAVTIAMWFPPTSSPAQHPGADAHAKAMLVLDASGSMWGQVGGEHKIVIAREVIGDLMTSWNPDVHLGLTAYGHRRKGDCGDIETLAPVGPDTAARIPALVNRIKPKGKTPLTDAVRSAANSLRYTENAATVILVTDGLETCHADPCAVARELEATGVEFTAHVIGFDLSEEESRAVQCIAELTGGISVRAGSAAELKEALTSVAEITKPRQGDKVRLALIEGGPLLEEGNAHFAFFAVDEKGQRKDQKAAENYGHVGFAEVPTGDYVVQVKHGQAIVAEPIAVTAEGKQHVVVLNAGHIRLNAIVGANTLSLSSPMKWSVQEAGRILESRLDHGIGAEFVLLPGDYVVKGELGGVKRELPIELAAGDIRVFDVDLRSGTVNLRALLGENGPQAQPSGGFFKWEAFAMAEDGTATGNALTSSLFATAKLVLPVGKNVISFQDGLVKATLPINVIADQTVDIDLLIDAAILNYRVLDASGAPIGGYPYVEFYPRGAEKVLTNRIGYFDRTAGSRNVPAEPLDVLVKIGKKTHVWPIDLGEGETHSIDFTVRE
jgi:Ca-activated chloride channel family protein